MPSDGPLPSAAHADAVLHASAAITNADAGKTRRTMAPAGEERTKAIPKRGINTGVVKEKSARDNVRTPTTVAPYLNEPLRKC
jgi:hypothetical protein